MKWFGKRKTLDPLAAYNRWAPTYFNESNPIKKLSDELIEKWLTDVEGKSFLDVGCGAGRFCKIAFERGASRILGVDLSPAMIEEAKKKCWGAEFKCVDFSNEKIHGQFDVVVCALVLGHIHSLDFVLTNLLDAVSPDGVLMITDFHPFLTLQGARRTFTEKKSGKTFEVEHHLHLFEEYFSCLARSNAYVQELIEPCWQGKPVVFGMKIKKHSREAAA